MPWWGEIKVINELFDTATVPTLVVPLSTTLDPDVESRYKAIKDTKVRHQPQLPDRANYTLIDNLTPIISVGA